MSNSLKFTMERTERGQNHLGFYGHRTCRETPGPGAYDPQPFMNPPWLRMKRPRNFPDRSPGFINVVDRGPLQWRPEPFSLSRLQSEPPMIHYTFATFWDWPEHARKVHPSAANHPSDSMTRRHPKGRAASSSGSGTHLEKQQSKTSIMNQEPVPEELYTRTRTGGPEDFMRQTSVGSQGGMQQSASSPYF
eukprot:gnl/TRDRNA2_/TRDRNA2_181422_c0_seq1.p1 gnl/TRDRNA2_/TRDRNA2_181422_c0~~gnl/TRDRNA2_/TRDRNA2_181422_c0_seq1.p1  ORF type:complete len:191 (-),score=19.08 gnl/TRDRNA2_/TRDRNA2_181422_c0_seq1:49-621(-)